MNVSPLAAPLQPPSRVPTPIVDAQPIRTSGVERMMAFSSADTFVSSSRQPANVSHLTVHPNAAVTIHVDEKEVLAMMWRGFSKGATSAAKRSWIYKRLADHHFNTYVKSVLREGNTEAVKSQVGKVDTVLPGEAERVTSKSNFWPFSGGEAKAPKSPPSAKDTHEAASIWARLGGAIEKQTRKVSPKVETRQARNAESLVGAWITRAEAYLAPQRDEEILQKPVQDKLRAQLAALQEKWHA